MQQTQTIIDMMAPITSPTELVHRGAGSAGSQWTESRCPVTALANGSAAATSTAVSTASTASTASTGASSSGPPGVSKCVADYCGAAACPKCCGESGLMPKNQSANGGPGSRVCPQGLPVCRGYIANKCALPCGAPAAAASHTQESPAAAAPDGKALPALKQSLSSGQQIPLRGKGRPARFPLC